MMRRRLSALFCLSLLSLSTGAAACRPAPAAKRYAIEGQILSVDRERQQVTVKHGDIVGLMPAMTMSFPVATPDLLNGREPGDLISGTLEVDDALGRLIAISRTGSAPLPTTSNEAALAQGLLAEGDLVPDAAFVDQADRRRSFSEWTGTLTLVTFIYTSCPLPNFCPLMDQNFATIERAVAEDPQLKGRVRLVSISFDPDHDTPAVLAAHAKKLRADPAVWTFLTGDHATVDRFAGRLGIGVVRPADGGDIAHNLRTILLGRDGRIAKIYSGSDWTPGAVLADLRAAGRAS